MHYYEAISLQATIYTIQNQSNAVFFVINSGHSFRVLQGSLAKFEV